jgi:pimeloyl-ACP methyl ester carboxylesterase
VAKQREHNCTARGTPSYCPVITIGGSYPGFLSAMMRLRYPAVVDMAYSASAPTLLYAQRVSHSAYYARVTASAERSVPGCPAAVRQAIAAYLSLGSKEVAARGLGLCTGETAMPAYIEAGNLTTLQLAVNMLLMYSFADLNMENYPPDSSSKLHKACRGLIEQPNVAGLRGFLQEWAGVAQLGQGSLGSSCYNLSTQLPAGHRPTISGADWSGVGTGANGLSWDYETCTYLIERIEVCGTCLLTAPRRPPFAVCWV